MFNFFLKILASTSYASIRLMFYSIYGWYFHLFAYEYFGYFSTFFMFYSNFDAFFLCIFRGLKFRHWMKCLHCKTTIELFIPCSQPFFVHHFIIYTDIQWKFFIKYSVWFKLMMFLFQHSSWCYESPTVLLHFVNFIVFFLLKSNSVPFYSATQFRFNIFHL